MNRVENIEHNIGEQNAPMPEMSEDTYRRIKGAVRMVLWLHDAAGEDEVHDLMHAALLILAPQKELFKADNTELLTGAVVARAKWLRYDELRANKRIVELEPPPFDGNDDDRENRIEVKLLRQGRAGKLMETNPETQLEEKQLHEELAKVPLTDNERAAITLYIEGYRMKEIALRLRGSSGKKDLNWASQQLSRGRKKLKKLLG